eukprot:UN02061
MLLSPVFIAHYQGQLLGYRIGLIPISLTGVSPSIPELFRSFQLCVRIPCYYTKTPHLPKDSVWAISFSFATTWEISFDFFSSWY